MTAEVCFAYKKNFAKMLNPRVQAVVKASCLILFFLLSQSGYYRFFLSNLRRPIKLVLNSPTRLSGSGVYSVWRSGAHIRFLAVSEVRFLGQV